MRNEIRTSRHKHTTDNQKLLVMTSEDTQHPQNNACPTQDAKPDWHAANADVHGIMTIHVERLRGPEHDHRKEIGTGDKGDDEGEAECSRLQLEPRRENRVLGSIDFPERKSNQQEEPDNQRSQYMGRSPGILDQTNQIASAEIKV